MNNKCDNWKPLLSEYIDDGLDSRRTTQVEKHLADCGDCRTFVDSLRSNKDLLRSLPLHQTSSTFDTRLAERIAALNGPPAVANPLAAWWQSVFAHPVPGRILRPAFAAVAAFGVIGTGFGLYFHTSIVGTPQTDTALIAHCVEQHRSYVESEPLTDVSAQALAGQVDGTEADAGAVDSSL
ncbi:MAG: anti-sigma factor family protein [Capsulimonadaceae bacterium]